MVDNGNMGLQATLPTRSEKERRRSERKPHIVETWISSPTATKPTDREEVTAVNLSRHGVAFESRRPLPLSTFHIIDIALGEQRMQSEIRIISCRPSANGRSEIGAEFC
jgi:hypothetical protein